MHRFAITAGRLATFAALGALAARGAAAETVKITVMGAPPPTVTVVQVTKEFFVPEVTKRLAASGKDFRIEWVEAYSQSMGRFTEVLESVEEGIAHLGVQIHAFEEAKLPLENMPAYVPFCSDDPHAVVRMANAVRAKVPELDRQWDKYNQIYLATGADDAIHIMTQFPLTRFDDLKGKKIGASGAMGAYMRNTGAVVVTSSMADAFTSIKSGLYDGYTTSWSLGFAYKIYEAAPNLTKVNFGSLPGTGLSFNKTMWNKLPAHAQQIMREVAAEWPIKYADIVVAKRERFEGMMKEKGAKITEMSLAERKRWAMQLPNMAKEWAERIDKEGQAGTKMLVAYMDGMRATGADIVRHWDRE